MKLVVVGVGRLIGPMSLPTMLTWRPRGRLGVLSLWARDRHRRGLADAMRSASVVVDAVNSLSFEDAAVMKCVKTAVRRITRSSTQRERP